MSMRFTRWPRCWLWSSSYLRCYGCRTGPWWWWTPSCTLCTRTQTSFSSAGCASTWTAPSTRSSTTQCRRSLEPRSRSCATAAPGGPRSRHPVAYSWPTASLRRRPMGRALTTSPQRWMSWPGPPITSCPGAYYLPITRCLMRSPSCHRVL